MRTIDADELLQVVTDWEKIYENKTPEICELFEQFKHCIKAKDTVVNIQKASDGITEEGWYADGDERGAYRRALYLLQQAVNLRYQGEFIFDFKKISEN